MKQYVRIESIVSRSTHYASHLIADCWWNSSKTTADLETVDLDFVDRDTRFSQQH